MELKNILDYIYPPHCPVCDRISPQGICEACRAKLMWIAADYCMKCGKPLEDGQEEFCEDCKKRKHLFVQNRALFSYQGDVRRSLYRLKYANRREYADCYAEEMAVFLERWIRSRGMGRIVPIPLHPSRQRRRGYNQAGLLARSLGCQLDIPVDEKLLRRTKKTAPQKQLTDRERQANLADAFCVCGEIRPGECILLVDDIFTTGSTMDAAARALLRAGNCRVYGVCVAIGG